MHSIQTHLPIPLHSQVYSFWIFDRHCNPIYHQDWSHLHPSLFSTSGTSNVASPTTAQLPSSGLASIGATLQRAGGAVTGTSSSAPASQPAQRPGQPSLPGVTRISAIPPRTNSADQRSSSGSQLSASVQSPPPLLPPTSPATAATGIGTGTGTGTGDVLPFDEEAKLVYGLVFSLRNMVRKLGGSAEPFNSFTTSTYTLAHLHTPTMYTFVILTDPVPPPSSIPTRSSDGYSIASTRSGFGTGGGIPGTGGMSLKGVLMQIYRGPWVEHVARNPLLTGLEREHRLVEPLDDDDDDDDNDDDDKQQSGLETAIRVASQGKVDRIEGVDSDGFRQGLERGKFGVSALHACPLPLLIARSISLLRLC